MIQILDKPVGNLSFDKAPDSQTGHYLFCTPDDVNLNVTLTVLFLYLCPILSNNSPDIHIIKDSIKNQHQILTGLLYI